MLPVSTADSVTEAMFARRTRSGNAADGIGCAGEGWYHRGEPAKFKKVEGIVSAFPGRGCSTQEKNARQQNKKPSHRDSISIFNVRIEGPLDSRSPAELLRVSRLTTWWEPRPEEANIIRKKQAVQG